MKICLLNLFEPFFYIYRLLEEGKLEEAERVKSQLEQSQRERRKSKESQGITHQPRWFR